HVFDLGDLIIALFRQLRLDAPTHARRFKPLIETVDLIERLFVDGRPVIVFFFRRVFRVVYLSLGVLGLVVVPKNATHVDKRDRWVITARKLGLTRLRSLGLGGNGSLRRSGSDYGRRCHRLLQGR